MTGHPGRSVRVPGRLLAVLVIVAGAMAEPAEIGADLAFAQAVAAQDETARIEELHDEAIRMLEAGRASEAEPIAREGLAIAERTFGEHHATTFSSLGILGAVLFALKHDGEAEQVLTRILAAIGQAAPEDLVLNSAVPDDFVRHLQNLNRPEEAERVLRSLLAVRQRLLPENHPFVAATLNNLAQTLHAIEQFEEAEQLHRRALAIFEQLFPEDDPLITASRVNLALVLRNLNRLEEAEQLLRSALASQRRTLPEYNPDIGQVLAYLGVVLQKLNRFGDAERFYREALTILEQASPRDEAAIAESMLNLAGILQELGRLDEAERLSRLALASLERELHEDDYRVASALNNLATLLNQLGRHDEAEQSMRRALSIFERNLSRDDPHNASAMQNLATIVSPNNPAEAERLYRRSLAILEKTLPDNHPSIADTLINLASTLVQLDRREDAEELLFRALAIAEQSMPRNHPTIGRCLYLLYTLLWQRGALLDALAALEGSTQILSARENRSTILQIGWREIAVRRSAIGFVLLRKHGEAAFDLLREARRKAFLDLQRERSGGAGEAIASAGARAQAGDLVLATLARERDTVLDKIGRLDDTFVQISSSTDIERQERARRLAELRAEAEELRHGLAAIDERIGQRFPAFAEISEGPPLAVEHLLPLLAVDEVLLSIAPFGNDGLFYAYGRDGGVFSPLPDIVEASLATRLRCSAARRLDAACADVEPVHVDEARAVEDAQRGAIRLVDGRDAGAFDLDLAHDLYNRLFPPETRDFLAGKKLIIAPAPELMGLPWHLLVTEAPPAGWNAPGADRAKAYREAKWLFQSHPSITVLPTVASLRALRGPASERTRAAADRAFLGIGDALTGQTEAERTAPAMDCGPRDGVRMASLDPARPAPRSAADVPAEIFTGARDAEGFALADPERLRVQPRLADSRCELIAVADSLGGEGTAGVDLLLGARATEEEVRRLDESGDLARYRVLHFGVHGLVGGELGIGEPALLLTPPDEASARDDGVLTASEISTLTLSADWVVLSACNTAAGSAEDAEALTGLAKSFFYAGARSLLVSSWPVYSPAAVGLTTRAFAAMAKDPGLDRGEALTIAMRDTLDAATNEFTAHPAYWGPFFLVGEGAR